jgi:transposase
MKRVQGTVKEVTKEEIEMILHDESTSKSGKVKALFDLGYEVKDIAAALDIRYNFAYNVVQNYVIVKGIEVETVQRETKKDAVFQLFDEGKNLTQVAKELKTNYNYIWKLHKEWEREAIKEAEATDEELKEAK